MIKYFNSTRFSRHLFVTGCITFLAICLFSCSKTVEIPLIPPTNEVGYDQPCLILFRNGSNTFRTKLVSNTLESNIFEGQGDREWNKMASVKVGKRQFIVSHNGAADFAQRMDFSIRLVTNRGEVVEETQRGTWGSNYETFLGFHVGDKGFIFGQDSYGDHRWFTQEVYADGTLAPSEAHSGTWGNYYPSATPMYVDGKTYLFLQNKDKFWLIARVWPSGQIANVSEGTWGHFWPYVTSVQVGGNTYLTGWVNGTTSAPATIDGGIMFIQKVNSDGTLGAETEGVEEIGVVPYITQLVGYEQNDKAYIFTYHKSTDGFQIREVTPDGHFSGLWEGALETDYDFVLPFNVYDPGNFRYRIGLEMSHTTGVPDFWMDYLALPWSGETRMGGGAALADINADGAMDGVMVGIQRMVGPSIYYYRIAWDAMNRNGSFAWSRTCWGPTIGNNQEGGGTGIADIDGNGIPDLLLMNIDAPEGANSFRYQIGWNMGSTGQATGWSAQIQGPSVGNNNSGGGAALGDIDKNGRPDLVLMAVDNPGGPNRFWYTVGRNLDATGKAASWTPSIIAPFNLGDLSAGGGAALADVNSNGKPDLVLTNIDSPVGSNEIWCYIGWDIDINGNVTGWSGRFIGPAMGNMTNGGGVAVGHINRNEFTDILLMTIDDPYGKD